MKVRQKRVRRERQVEISSMRNAQRQRCVTVVIKLLTNQNQSFVTSMDHLCLDLKQEN